MQLLTFDLEDEYNLIGIHTTLEDYRLAFLLNKYLNAGFVRFKHNLDFKGSEAEFPVFEYKDSSKLINYYLINNKYLHSQSNQKNEGLFGGNYSTTSYLIPEKNNVDYFLKIEGIHQPVFIRNLLNQLNRISHIITSYSIEPDSLKSKSHLIF